MNAQNDWLNSIKEKFKKYPRLYFSLIDIFSPICPNRKYKLLLDSLPEDATIVNLGSGPYRLSSSTINVDLSSYQNVDVVADICALPFADNSIDGIINVVVLEHVPVPIAAVDEMGRVLKPGGLMFSVVPFIVGYHASPHDYTRWTKSGVERLFSDFEMIEMGIGAGPTSSFLWVLHEWLATLLSFNVSLLYRFLFVFFMVLTCPLKWLDLVLGKYKSAENIASSFYFLGKKDVETTGRGKY